MISVAHYIVEKLASYGVEHVCMVKAAVAIASTGSLIEMA